jgi:hypothetical protein
MFFCEYHFEEIRVLGILKGENNFRNDVSEWHMVLVNLAIVLPDEDGSRFIQNQLRVGFHHLKEMLF